MSGVLKASPATPVLGSSKRAAAAAPLRASGVRPARGSRVAMAVRAEGNGPVRIGINGEQGFLGRVMRCMRWVWVCVWHAAQCAQEHLLWLVPQPLRNQHGGGCRDGEARSKPLALAHARTHTHTRTHTRAQHQASAASGAWCCGTRWRARTWRSWR